MGNASPSHKDQADGTRQVLGDILDGGRAAVRPSEREWVELVRSIAAGDQRALNALYERSNRAVFTLAMRITANRHTAEEVTLDVFHHVWRSASGYDPVNGTVLGWVMNQARSRALDRVRFEQRKKRVHRSPEEPPSQMADSAEILERKEQDRRLQDALTLLTSEERAVIEAAFFSGLSYPEIAEKLAQPLGTVKTRIRAGLGKLRKALNLKDRSDELGDQ